MRLLNSLREAFREWSGRKPEPLVVPNLAAPEEVSPTIEPVQPLPEMIPVVPTYDLRTLEEFFESNETLINRYMVKKLAYAIKHDEDTAVLFFIPTTGMTASVRREDFEATLKNIINHFIKVEEYERINKCKKLLDKHSVNEVVRRSR